VIESEAPHDEQVAKIVARQEEAIRSAIEMYKNTDQPELQEKYERLLENNKAAVQEQAKEYTNRQITGSYWMLGPKFGGDRLYEVRMRRGKDDSVCFMLQRQLDEKCLRNVWFDTQSGVVRVSASGVTVGVIEPALIGRLLGRALSLVESDCDLRCSYDGNYQGKSVSEVCIKYNVNIADSKDDTASLKSDAESVEEGSLVGRVVVDPARGYICPLIEYGHSGEEPSVRMECSDYFRVASTDLWFPQSCVIKSNMKGEKQSTRMRFRPDTVRLNQSLPQDLFSVTIPQGTHLVYCLDETQERDVACDVKIAIDELDSLLNHRCLQARSIQPVTVKRRWPSFFVYGNLALILVLVLILIWRKRGGSSQPA
jgi:hypothetical protein